MAVFWDVDPIVDDPALVELDEAARTPYIGLADVVLLDGVPFHLEGEPPTAE